MNELESRLRQAIDRLPVGLQDHIARVETVALGLAERFGVDADRLRLAVLAHDLVRGEPDSRLVELASQYSVEIDDVERASPILLHGPIAARILEREYGFRDAEVQHAAAVHTTGAPGLTPLQRLLFVADKIEPDKAARKPALNEVERLAEADLDAAMLRFLDTHLVEAVERRWHLHPLTVAARNELLGLP